jgi:hypothetical protein
MRRRNAWDAAMESAYLDGCQAEAMGLGTEACPHRATLDETGRGSDAAYEAMEAAEQAWDAAENDYNGAL